MKDKNNRMNSMQNYNKENLNWAAISNELFEWIYENLEHGKTILEFGSGTGTIELTKYWNVYSVEQSAKWIGKAPNSNYIHAPIKGGWYDTNIVFNNIPEQYDLLLIDGPMGYQLRSGIDKYIDRFSENVPIILDDTHRIPDKEHAIALAKQLNKEYIEIEGWQKNFIIILPKENK